MSDELSRRLGYSFKNPSYLKKALTHRSCGQDDNERLEFLGDAIVNFVIAEMLYHQYPTAKEGELSRWRASLVNREMLGELARKFQVGRYLFLGLGELKSGGKERLSILSCAMEAIIGAIYLDGGFHAACECLVKWFMPLLSSLSSVAHHKDPKTLLQEYLQSKHFPLPTYQIESIEGEAHQQTFIVSCTIDGIDDKIVGRGSSRRKAEQESATLMLARIQK